MGKQKQQVISRFFAPKSNSNSQPSPSLPPPPPPPKPPSPKISATISFSPSKRSLLKTSPNPSKKPKPSLPNPPHNPSLHQKFLTKLLDTPSFSPPSNHTPATTKYTPLEQQVLDLKSTHPDVLLMIEVGYKYRFFGEDAQIAARVLGIIAHLDHNFLTASVPTFRLSFHVRRLVSAGYKVGVVKQTETAAIKSHGSNRVGPFSRGLSALYTKSTVEAAEDMGGEEEVVGCRSSNHLVCVVETAVSDNTSGFDVKVGVIAVEISNGEVMYGEFNDNVMRDALEALILSLEPAEILLGEPLSTQTHKLLRAYSGPSSSVRIERTSRDCFNDGGALAEVMSLYENVGGNASTAEYLEQNMETSKAKTNIVGIEGIMAMPGLAVQALALTMRYLKQFGFERMLCLGASFRPFSSNTEMTLSANSLQQLEILNNNSDGSVSGSLLKSMNHTYTSFGSRLLRHWVTHPLCDRNSINARLDAVSEIAESMGPFRASQDIVVLDEEASCGAIVQPEVNYLISSVLTTLGRSPDVQRGITRIFHRTATAAEFVAVINAVLSAGTQLQQLHLEDEESNIKVQGKTVLSPLLRRLILTTSSPTLIGHAAKLLSSLNRDAADQGDLQNLFIISNGQFPEVARGRAVVQLAKEKLDLLIGIYRKQLGMHNLEFMSVSGSTHLIELPSDMRVPSNWVMVSSTKKMICYHPPDVLTALDALMLAKEELAVACRATWDSFLMGFGSYYAEFQAAVQALAALDCLHSLAILSRNQNYVRPIFVDDDEPSQIHILSGCHPVLESILQDNFVPNDTNLHSDGEFCQIITGPNMGGKSCYIRQVALIAIMAQVGSFVPASSAKLHVLDGVYTRMGASDGIQQGTSTFFEELSEASHILQNCTSRSLVILDELGRGTSTHDGVAIAYATLHHLLNQKKCMVLFVTHYPNIMDIKDSFPSSIGVYHVSYLTPKSTSDISDSKLDPIVENQNHGNITFLYKVVPGVSDKSFGLNVARLAQLPSSCIARAAIMATKLEMEVRTRMGTWSAQKLPIEIVAPPEENRARENYSNPQEFSHRERSGGTLVDEKEGFEGLAKAYHELFSHLHSALGSTDASNSLCSLEEARKLATKMTNRCWW